MQPHPGRLVGAQTKNTFQSQSVRPILLTGQVPDSTKPEAQGLPGVLEYRTGRNGGFEAAMGTFVQASPYVPRFGVSAARTSESFGPAKLEQIFDTCFLSTKPLFELDQCFWIVLHRRLFYQLSLVESSGYAYYGIMGIRF